MGTYFRFTSSATLLIGLQLFSPGRVFAVTQPTVPYNIASSSFYVASESRNSLTLGQTPSASIVLPPVGKPKKTGAGGTRCS